MSDGDDDIGDDTPLLGVHRLPEGASASEVDRFQSARNASRRASFYRGFNREAGPVSSAVRSDAIPPSSRARRQMPSISLERLRRMDDSQLRAWEASHRQTITDHLSDFIWWPVMTDPDDAFASQLPYLRERVLVLHALMHSTVLSPTQRQRVSLAFDACRYLFGQLS